MTMTHPAIDVTALGRLRRHLGLAEPAPAASAATEGSATASQPTSVGGRARAVARRLASPLVERARAELALAAEREQAALHAEVAELRQELVRTRTAHAAELAALHEELRSR